MHKLFLGASLPGLLFVAGCDSSTAPSHVSARAIARHFDSLMVQAESLNTNSGDARAEVLWRLELAPAFGARPIDVTVTTASGPKRWQGFMWKATNWRIAFPSDSILAIVAYSDNNVTSAVFAEMGFGQGLTDTEVGVLTGDTLPASSYSNGPTATSLGTLSSAGRCIAADGLSAAFDSLPVTCTSATFEGSVSYSLALSSGPLADFRTIRIAPQQFEGVWLK